MQVYRLRRSEETYLGLLRWQVYWLLLERELSGLAIKSIDELPLDKALELFYLHYPTGKKDEHTVEALLAHIGYHTLTIELFAKTCEISPSTTPQRIYELLTGKTPS